MAPKPVANWTGVRDATHYGERCPQPTPQMMSAWAWYPSTEGKLGENCCVLNVFTPDLDANARRPVMFYIHGGGFSRNSGQGVFLDGTNLAKFGNAVVITLNHRLNVFGYMNLGFLDPQFADAASAGQLDLIVALNWVKNNVHVFGGDPGNVTVFGQSGGGSKINTLMVMPAAKGLFHRAINMSGSSSFKFSPASSTEPIANQLLKTLGIDKSNVRKIQDVPADQLLAAHGASLRELKAEDAGPVIDGRHIMVGPLTPEGLAMHASIPLIFGMTESEARWFMRDLRNFKVNEQQVKARIKGQFGFDDAKTEAVMAAFRKDEPGRSAADVLMAVATEGLVRMHMLRSSRCHFVIEARAALCLQFRMEGAGRRRHLGLAAHGRYSFRIRHRRQDKGDDRRRTGAGTDFEGDDVGLYGLCSHWKSQQFAYAGVEALRYDQPRNHGDRREAKAGERFSFQRPPSPRTILAIRRCSRSQADRCSGTPNRSGQRHLRCGVRSRTPHQPCGRWKKSFRGEPSRCFATQAIPRGDGWLLD